MPVCLYKWHIPKEGPSVAETLMACRHIIRQTAHARGIRATPGFWNTSCPSYRSPAAAFWLAFGTVVLPGWNNRGVACVRHGCAHCKRTAPQEEKEEDEAEDAEESEGGGPNGQREDDWPVSESESEEQRAGTATPTPLPPFGPDPVGTNKAGHTERSQSGAAKQDRAKRSTIILVCCICKRNSNEEA